MTTKNKYSFLSRALANCAVAFIFVLALSSCTKSDSSKPFVLLLLKSSSTEFFQEIDKGFREGWTDPDISVLVQSGRNTSDIETQKKALDIVALKNERMHNLRGVVITPSASGRELLQQIKRLRDSGVPVLLVDTGIDQQLMRSEHTDYNAFLASDNIGGGAIAAQTLWEGMGSGSKSCRLLVLGGHSASDTAQQRRDGFLKEFERLQVEAKADCPTPIEKTAEWDRSQAREIVKALYVSGQIFDGIFAANDDMALGALEAWTASSKSNKPIIVGFDAINEARTQIDNGHIYASIAQNPYEMGNRAAKSLLRIINDHSLEVFSKMAIPVTVVKR